MEAQKNTTPKLSRILRLDSLPVNSTYFTEEGYLVDHPVLTSIGIFEYTNKDGSIRRELRLPEEVFKPESLKTYKGKPIIVTHDAGLITKDNVSEEAIGTILSEGYKDGDDVRAEIIIHDTDEMKSVGLKELSLGYNLTLDETPGVWEGEPYDAIQRDITINHLALVLQARAGDQARLNIDSRDRTSKGVKTMSKKTKKFGTRADGVLSPEELQKAIADYKKRRAERIESQKDDDMAPPADDDTTKTKETDTDEDDTAIAPDDQKSAVQAIKDRRDRRDEDGDPKDKDAAMGVIAQQDDDMDKLFDIIDTLLAERDMNTAKPAAAADGDDDDLAECNNTDDDDEDDLANKPASALKAVNGDDDDEDDDDLNEDEDDDDIPTTNEGNVSSTTVTEPTSNMDSIDAIVRQRVQLGVAGSKLGIKGLENMKLSAAKKTVIRAVNPSIRLDGKSEAYINGAFAIAMNTVNAGSRKGTNYQKKQMFNRDSASRRASDSTSADAARARMIERRMNKEVK